MPIPVNIEQVVEKLNKFFPGFQVRHGLDHEQKNNYYIQHPDREVIQRLSDKLEHDVHVVGRSGKAKHVADFFGNAQHSIILTDQDYNQLCNRDALLFRVDGSRFKISADQIIATQNNIQPTR